MRTAIAVSIMLHLLVFFSIFHAHATPREPTTYQHTGEDGIAIQLITKQDVPDESTTTTNGVGTLTTEEKVFCSDKDKRYKGIGITYYVKQRVVLSAPQSYPAYKAGVRVGDGVIDPGYVPNKDGTVDVIVTRDEKELHFVIMPGEICYKDS